MLLAARNTATRLLPAMLLEEHLLPMAELEVLVTLLTADNLRRDDLLLASTARVTERWVLIALLHIVNLGSNREVKVGRALPAVELPVLELTAVLVTVGTADRLRKTLLSKDLLLAASKDKALPTVTAGDLLIIIKAARLLLRTPCGLLHSLLLLMLGYRLLVLSLLLGRGLKADHGGVVELNGLGERSQQSPVLLGEISRGHGSEHLKLADQLIADERIIVRHFWLDF
jgi:hypothetical protein